ncbi:hypothetical protein [Flavobacterium phragmitis]|uniref:Uncharacterized protein n=1 Tax=Flavobacterium phragmitis TaxID=739143 RepID=A0A1I1X5H1_9FLAO|nr:hypothetical protein [Flavobacterium phragmitis]SFE02629.1 hypothetical protein SAMN05216297_11863 [Flavobacterium phragmitis]
MNKKIFTSLLIVCLFLSALTYGQQEDKRIKIEISLKDGNKVVKGAVRSATFSFTKSVMNAETNEVKNNYYFSLDFEKQDIVLLTAFMKNKAGIDGQITMTDTYGKQPTRKFDFTKGRIDSLSDQITADYNSAYMSLICDTLVIDGVKID